MEEEPRGPLTIHKLVDGDRRVWYQVHDLPFERVGFYPLLAEERAWAESWWGTRRPRWFIQWAGGGTVRAAKEAKSHPFWKQVIRFIEGYGGGQVFVLDDEACASLQLVKGLALAATCDRFVGFDSGPFWVAAANGAECFAMFPFGPPDELYPVKQHPQIKAVYCPHSCHQVPVGDISKMIMEHWDLHGEFIPMSTPTGLAFYAPKQDPPGEWLDSGAEVMPWVEAWEAHHAGGVAIDCGLFTGGWTDYLAKRHDRVYGFDPSKTACAVVRQMCHVRGHRNVRLQAVGVSDYVGTGRLACLDSSGNGRQEMNDDEPSWGMQVRPGPGSAKVDTLDNLIPETDDVRTIMMDIEGHEGAALRGARNLIARCRPGIFIEVHGAHNFYDKDVRGAVMAELATHGYIIHEPIRHPYLHHVYAYPGEADPFHADTAPRRG